MKIDPKSGAILGYVESVGNHCVEVTTAGELLNGPGPNFPQWYRR